MPEPPGLGAEPALIAAEAGARTSAADATTARSALRTAMSLLHVPDHRSDRDALIAATALVHGMTVVTRNVADFEPTGVPILNPWNHGSRAAR